MDLEKITITGNIVADAKINQGDKGPFTTLSVACNVGKDEIHFYSIAVSGDAITKYLVKGKKIAVEGYLDLKIGQPNQYGVQDIYRSIKRAQICLL